VSARRRYTTRVRCLACLVAAACGSSSHPATGDGPGSNDAAVIADAPIDAPAAAGPWRVVVGNVGSCALHTGGSVKCWGGIWSYETPGFRGDAPGEMGANLPFVNLGTGRTVKDLSVGTDQACAVLDNDRVKCWGSNAFGQLGLGDTRDRGLAVGDMGDGLPYVDLGTGRTARAVSAGDDMTCALLDNNTVKCWGLNGGGELGLGDQVARGGMAGQMGDALPAVDLGTGRTAKQVFAGYSRACALLDDDSLKCWGNDASGALGNGEATTNIGVKAGQMGDALAPIALGTGLHALTIAHGGETVCAVVPGSRVKCWGRNLEGELAVGDTMARGGAPGEMGDALPFANLGGSPVAIAGAAGHECAVIADGSLACWGSNYSGTLGLGLADNASVGTTPAQVGSGMPRVMLAGPVAAISAFGLDTCATLTDGHIQCWGANSLGELGLGDTRARGNSIADMGTNLPFVDLGP
jgi:alpha-tubulin suppressor-like RCC1 family protein